MKMPMNRPEKATDCPTLAETSYASTRAAVLLARILPRSQCRLFTLSLAPLALCRQASL